MTTADTNWQAPPRLRSHRCPDPRLSTRLCMTNCVCAIVYMFMCTYICVYTTTHTHLCMLNRYYVNTIVYLILCILNCVVLPLSTRQPGTGTGVTAPPWCQAT